VEIDPKKLVATGYDRIADRYLDWPGGAEVRRKYTARLLDLIPIGGCVLDLGCGPGVPVAQELSRKVDVWGVDISARQIELARRNVPAARFIESDMMTVDLPAGHFDAVSAFFAITHLPRN
jgi:ubiquinone/menaquinone biosynthesis C-methylase UbiE